MTTLLFTLLVLVAASGLGYLLAVTIRSDGYGSTPPPAGRPRDPFEPRFG